MIHNAPMQSRMVIEEKLPLIQSMYPMFECHYIGLHPFLRCPSKQYAQDMVQDLRPNKYNVFKNCQPITWNEFLQLSGIADISALDRALGKFHGAMKWCNKHDFEKLVNTLINNPEIRYAEVDSLPERWELGLLKYLSLKGYNDFLVSSDSDAHSPKQLTAWEIYSDWQRVPSKLMLRPLDRSFLIATGFDARYTCLMGSAELIHYLVTSIDIEGFYANEETSFFWSSAKVPEEDRTKDEDMWDFRQQLDTDFFEYENNIQILR